MPALYSQSYSRLMSSRRAPGQYRLAEADVVADRGDLVVLRDVVAVQVGPAAHVALRRERVVALREAERLAGHVLVDARLECGPGVAEQVVGDAEARRPVGPARHAGDRLEAARPDEPAGRSGLVGDLPVEVLEADAVVDRQPLDAPGVLREDAEVGVEIFLRLARRVVNAHAIRHARCDRAESGRRSDRRAWCTVRIPTARPSSPSACRSRTTSSRTGRACAGRCRWTAYSARSSTDSRSGACHRSSALHAPPG